MTTDRMLAWFGLLLGFIGLFPLFHESRLVAILFLVILSIAAAYLVWREYQTTRSALTLLVMTKSVRIHDITGRNATLTRTQTARINKDFLTEMWFRNMVSDGSFGPVSIDGKPPTDQTNMSCLVSYCKRFNPPLPKGTIQDVTLTCDVYDSFMASSEGLLHEVAQDTQRVILEIVLPQGRPCLTATLMLEAGGEPARALAPPSISSDRLKIRAEIKSPHTGFTYNLGWTW